MSSLPHVTATTREQIVREFDDFGPVACTEQVMHALERGNPEILDMALKCAKDVGEPDKIMVGFAMFYRLLEAESLLAEAPIELPLPRVSPQTRDFLVRKIEEQGAEGFVMLAIGSLERDNPELLQMAHAFASGQADYLRVMEGFALLYQSLVTQLSVDRARLH
jgi:hypothetical protein